MKTKKPISAVLIILLFVSQLFADDDAVILNGEYLCANNSCCSWIDSKCVKNGIRLISKRNNPLYMAIYDADANRNKLKEMLKSLYINSIYEYYISFQDTTQMPVDCYEIKNTKPVYIKMNKEFDLIFDNVVSNKLQAMKNASNKNTCDSVKINNTIWLILKSK